MRKLTAAACGLVLTLGLAGCVVFQSPPVASQQELIGKVRVSFTICVTNTDTANNPGCPEDGNTESSTADGPGQALVAFRVPAGSAGPATFSQSAGEALTFTRSPSYEAELEKAVPAGAGRKWVGYLSSIYTYVDPPDDGTPARSASFAVDFALPEGTPFTGPFRVRPVVGARDVDEADDQLASDPVSCGSQPTGGGGVDTANVDVICIDDPDEATLATDIEVATTDLEIVGGTSSVNPGTTATVPFDAKLAGALPAATTFALKATTNLPGAAATPSPASIAPGPNSSTRVNVPIAVPSAAGPGTFTVGLTATLPNGQSRSATAALTVLDKQKPAAANLAIKPKVLTPSAPSVARVGSAVTYRLSEAATVRFRVQRCVKKRGKTRCKALRGSFTHAGVAGANRFNFTGFLRDKPLKRGSYRLVGTPVDAAKNRGKSVRAGFRVKR